MKYATMEKTGYRLTQSEIELFSSLFSKEEFNALTIIKKQIEKTQELKKEERELRKENLEIKHHKERHSEKFSERMEAESFLRDQIRDILKYWEIGNV